MAARDCGTVSNSNYFERWATDPVLLLSDSLDQEWIRDEQPSSESALLLGSGPGRELLWLRDMADRITCIDIDEEAVAQGQKYFDSDEIVWLNDDLMTHDFEGNSFDLALALGLTLAYVDDLVEALETIYSALGIGGLLVFSVPNAEHPHEQSILEKREALGIGGRHAYRISYVEQALEKVGFSTVKIRGQRHLIDFIPSSDLLTEPSQGLRDKQLQDLVTLEARWSRSQPATTAKILWAYARKTGVSHR